tara:strand:- start:56 stop:892 length:837 start_codon:yes stop_codon:yes gene_type:complete
MTPNSEVVSQNVAFALQEDIGTGDVTVLLIPETRTLKAEIISREDMVLCGRPWADKVFNLIDKTLSVNWLYNDGMLIAKNNVLCRIEGSARSILTAERTALNFLQTLSATSTKVHHFSKVLNGTNTRLLDTRKTIPGMRHAQKYAVFCGGGLNHRQGLFDAFLIKENHIAASGSIAKAIRAARAINPDILLEIEVENLEEFREALECKPDRIMLDNFNLTDIEAAVAIRKEKKCELEVSGGLGFNALAEIAKLGVEYVSVGELTKSIQAIDLSLLIRG